MDESGLLGEVVVGVRADLTQLVSGFADAKRASEQFEKQLDGKTTPAAKKFDEAVGSSASKIDKQTRAVRENASAKKVQLDETRNLAEWEKRWAERVARSAQIDAQRAEAAKKSAGAIKETAGAISSTTSLIDKNTAALNAQKAAGQARVNDINRQTEAERKREAELRQSTQTTKENVRETKSLESAMGRIASSYDKPLAAMARYERELLDITRLEKAGMITGQQAARYRAGAARSYDEASRGVRSLGTAATFASKPIRALEVALGAITVGSIISGIKRIGDSAQEIRNLSQELGISTEDLQVYQYQAAQTGVSNTQLETGFRNLSKTIGEARTGSAQDAKVFQLLGYSMAEIKKGAIDINDVLPKTADLFKRIEDPAVKATIAQKLFGESGQRMIAMLSGGSAEIDNLRKSMKELGLVLSEKELQEADETANKLEAVQKALSIQVAGVVVKNAAAIQSLATSIGTLTGKLLQFLNSDPEKALAIMGAILGLRFGPVGALAGGIGGYALGKEMRQQQLDSSGDLATRRSEFQKARTAYSTAKSGRFDPGVGLSRDDARRIARNNFIKQGQLLIDALAAAKPAGGGKSGSGLTAHENALLAGLNAPKGGKGKDLAAEAERKRVAEERRKEAFERELAGEEDQQLRAMAELTTSIEEQRDLQLEQVDRQEAAYKKRIERDIAEGQISDEGENSEAKQLLRQNAINAQLEREIIKRDAADKLLAERMDTERSNLSNEQDLLSAQADLAKSSGERRDLAMRMLDVQFELQRLQLEEVLASQTATAAQKDIAAARLAMLGQLKGLATKSAEKATASPWERYVDENTMDAGELKDSLEEIKVKGIDGLIDGLAEAGLSWKKMGQAAKQVLADITTDLIRLQLRAALFGGSGTMMGGGGILGFLGKIGGSLLGGLGGGGLGSGLGIAGSFGDAGSIFGSIPMTDLGTLAPVLHAGTDSVSGTAGHMRRVPSSTFIRAPRYHNGLGLGPRERAAIIEDGEKIIPRGKSLGAGMSFGDIVVQGAKDGREARQTARQLESALRDRLGRSAKYGFSRT